MALGWAGWWGPRESVPVSAALWLLQQPAGWLAQCHPSSYGHTRALAARTQVDAGGRQPIVQCSRAFSVVDELLGRAGCAGGSQTPARPTWRLWWWTRLPQWPQAGRLLAAQKQAPACWCPGPAPSRATCRRHHLAGVFPSSTTADGSYRDQVVVRRIQLHNQLVRDTAASEAAGAELALATGQPGWRRR